MPEFGVKFEFQLAFELGKLLQLQQQRFPCDVIALVQYKLLR